MKVVKFVITITGTSLPYEDNVSDESIKSAWKDIQPSQLSDNAWGWKTKVDVEVEKVDTNEQT